MVTALKDPMVMIGSDAILDGNNNHPRASGCFSRVLGRYVREQHLISLPEALAKMTIQPARRLEAKCRRCARRAASSAAPMPTSRCSTRTPWPTPRPSRTRRPTRAGIEWVLLGGQVVKDRSGVIDGVNAGQPIMSSV